MVRAPCCAKVGLKKGPWTTEEDKILVSYIENNGHDNWRALPKKAGLLRCGKSCRLRWANYLRPDIKRGNFSKEEEETIFELHETLGNKWSAIAARLPGRTDNEIKNVWHTHLKKRLGQKPATSEPVPQPTNSSASSPRQSESSNLGVIPSHQGSESQTYTTMSPQPSSSEFSSFTDASISTHNMGHLQIEDMDLWETFPVIDGSLWSEPPLSENTSMPPELLAATDDSQAQSQFNSIEEENMGYTNQSIFDDDMDFWYNLFVKAGGSTELSEF